MPMDCLDCLLFCILRVSMLSDYEKKEKGTEGSKHKLQCTFLFTPITAISLPIGILA